MKSPAGFHHVTLTVTDLPRSIDWYERVLGMTKVSDREGPTWSRAVMRSEGGLVIALTVHESTGTDRFDERRVGLDHLSIACEGRDEVAAWERHLTELGVEHGELVDAGYGYVLTSRDPDGIPVEFFANPAP
jgi:catechol 2,3-dioxygenase-like lactoylglutathione lyase family enzyme